MKFAVHFQLGCRNDQNAVQLYQEAMEQARLADLLGFDSIWPVEQHFNQRVSTISAPMLFLSALATQTERIRLGTAISILPLTHPLRLMEELFTLDVISQGRAELGVGRGAIPEHFAGFGLSLSESRERMLESLQVIEQAQRQEILAYQGDFYTIPPLSISPPPVQKHWSKPRVAANSPDTFTLMGQLGYPVFAASHINPFFMLRDLIPLYRQAFAEGDGDHQSGPSVDLLCPLYTASSMTRIRDEIGASVENMKRVALEQIAPSLQEDSIAGLDQRLAYLQGMSFEQMNRDMAIFAEPHECIDRIQQLEEELGIERLICWFNPGSLVPHQQVMDSMTSFAEQVMPYFSEQ